MFQSPTSYQGAKNRIANQIVDQLLKVAGPTTQFYDLCCGSGAVTVELLNRGVAASSITLCDAGPWGLFWKEIGEGTFDLSLFGKMIKELPSDLALVKGHLELLSKKPATEATTQTFLLLQAGSFGSKPIWIEGTSWKNCSFRSYWMPTATSNRRSPVNPMMPLPKTLFQRVENLCKNAKGLAGIHDDVLNIVPSNDSIVYIDPPYKNTTPYGHIIDVVSYAKSLPNVCFVSEGCAVSGKAICLATSDNRKKGGISGSKKIKSNEEWLSFFNYSSSSSSTSDSSSSSSISSSTSTSPSTLIISTSPGSTSTIS